MRPRASSHSPGAVPRPFSRTVRAFRHHRLAGVYFGHRAAQLPEARFNLAHDGGIARELSPEQIGHGVARAVVLGGTKAAACNHQVRRGLALGKCAAKSRRVRRRQRSCA